jgi:hypothetical protein
MPTSYAAPVAVGEFASVGLVPVWNGSEGNIDGRAFEPIYPSASKAAANNRSLYDLLALMDMLRGGRIRERRFAELKLKEALG